MDDDHTFDRHLPEVSYEELVEIDRVLARRDRERLEITSETGE